MSSKLAFATILVASYATTTEAAGSCLAKDDNAWAAIGLTVTTNTATNVAGLGSISAASGWSEVSSGSAAAVCNGGVADFSASLPAITGGTSGTAESTPTNGTGSGLKANVSVTNATTLASITVTAAGTGYAINDVLTFPAKSGGNGDHAAFNYTLVAADFAAFTASGVTENAVCTTITCGAGYEQKSNHASLKCAGVTCNATANSNADRTTCCDAVVTTTTAAPEPEPTNTTAAPETLPDNSASTEITSVIAVVTVIAAALAGL